MSRTRAAKFQCAVLVAPSNDLGCWLLEQRKVFGLANTSIFKARRDCVLVVAHDQTDHVGRVGVDLDVLVWVDLPHGGVREIRNKVDGMCVRVREVTIMVEDDLADLVAKDIDHVV